MATNPDAEDVDFAHDEPCDWAVDNVVGKRCGETPTTHIGEIYYVCEEHYDDFDDLLDGDPHADDYCVWCKYSPDEATGTTFHPIAGTDDGACLCESCLEDCRAFKTENDVQIVVSDRFDEDVTRDVHRAAVLAVRETLADHGIDSSDGGAYHSNAVADRVMEENSR